MSRRDETPEQIGRRLGIQPCAGCGEFLGGRYIHQGKDLCWECYSKATGVSENRQVKPQTDKTRPKGTLPHLPHRDASLSDTRSWLTRAFNPPDGYQFDGFERHGRNLSDPAWVTLKTPAGGDVRFRFPEQRALAKPTNLRSSVVSITDGLCRMGPVTNPEAQDIWVALCSVAHVAAQQDEVEVFREQLDAFLAVTQLDTQHTLEGSSGQFDTLTALQERGRFERRHAVLMANEVDDHLWDRRPIRLIDFETGHQWVRVSELEAYLRHVIGIQLGHGVLDGRMSEIGAIRETFERRNGKAHPHCSLYRLPSVND